MLIVKYTIDEDFPPPSAGGNPHRQIHFFVGESMKVKHLLFLAGHKNYHFCDQHWAQVLNKPAFFIFRLLEKPVFVIALVFLVGAMCVSCKDERRMEQEPNNNFENATLFDISKDISGCLESVSDRDFYKIPIESDSVLDISVSGVKGINIAMRIGERGDSERMLKLIDDTRKSSPERIANIFAKPGLCYIEILHGDKDKKVASDKDFYTISVKKREPLNEEREPNDTFSEATQIIAGTEMTGYFSPAYNWANQNVVDIPKFKEHLFREEDWYYTDIELDSGRPIILDASITGVPGINSELYLYGEQLNEIAKSDSGERGAGEEIRGVGITKAGRYYFMVTEKNYESNNDDPYTLTVSFREYDSSKEMEPNNDFTKANTIINDQIIGEINQPSDVDYYCYKPVQESGIYTIKLQGSNEIDYILSVYNSHKEKIVDINNQGSGGEVYPDLFTHGDVYFSVSARSGATKKNEYMLIITPLSNIEDMELEPNDTQSQATKVTTNKIIGYISHKGDKDYYLLEYENRYNAVFDIRGVKNGKIKVSITDPLGYIINSEQVKNNGSATMKETIDKKGYLIVESNSDDYENPYSITIRGQQ